VRAIVLDAFLTVPAKESWRAGASVRALAGVETGGAVLTGLVVGAVVEVLVAPQSTPSGLAVALVGLGAGSVHASRIAHAFVAILAGPTGATFAFSWFLAFAMFGVTPCRANGFGAVV